jgi:hypothetical protein
MPGNLASGLDVEAAHTQVVAGHGNLLLGEIDLAEQLLGDVLVRRGARPLAVGRLLAGGAGSGKGGGGDRQRPRKEGGESGNVSGRGHGVHPSQGVWRARFRLRSCCEDARRMHPI